MMVLLVWSMTRVLQELGTHAMDQRQRSRRDTLTARRHHDSSSDNSARDIDTDKHDQWLRLALPGHLGAPLLPQHCSP